MYAFIVHVCVLHARFILPFFINHPINYVEKYYELSQIQILFSVRFKNVILY